MNVGHHLLPASTAVKTSYGALFWIYLAILVWVPLPWASHTPLTSSLFGLLALTLLVIVTVAATLGKLSWPKARADLVIPLFVWLLWLAWIALQVQPLGEAELSQLSPTAAGIHRAAGQVSGTVPLWSLSIAPARTLEALHLSVAYFSLYLCTLLLVQDSSRQRLVLTALVMSGAFQALYGSVMTMTGLEWGFFAQKTAYLGVATGTFVNRNHFASYLYLTAACGLALILADLGRGRHRQRKSLMGMMASFLEGAFTVKFRIRLLIIFIVIGLVLTRSRMGNATFFTTLFSIGFLYVLLKERRYLGRALLLFASMLIIDVYVVSSWFGIDQVVERMTTVEGQDSTQGRIEILEQAPLVLNQYWPIGSGLGTFANAYEGSWHPPGSPYLDHAHNDYLEFMIEVGAPGVAILALLIGVHLLHALRVIHARRRRLPVAVCTAMLMCVASLGLHAFVEFNLQIPAIAATFSVILALAAGCTVTSARTASRVKVDRE